MEFQAKLKAPFCMVISGPTLSGKTTLVSSLIRRRMEVIDPPLENVMYMYGEWQDSFFEIQRDVPNIQFHHGLIKNVEEIPRNILLIIDDLLTDLAKSEEAVNLFIRGSHHRNISVVGLIQSFFYKGLRTLTLNCKYIVLTRNVREANFIRVLGAQMKMGKRNDLLEYAWNDVMEKPYGYLVIDFSQDQDNKFRLRNSLFPDAGSVVYSD